MGYLVLISLVVITTIIYVVQLRIWQSFPNIIFPIFIAIFYYWSLAGAWIFLLDQSVNWGTSIGIHYHYLLGKMYMVHIDSDYLESIWLIGTFLIILQLSILTIIKKIKIPKLTTNPSNTLSTNVFIGFGITFLFLSYWIVQDVVAYSLILNESIYLNIRSPFVSHYAFHQLFNWGMIMSFTIPLAFQLRDKVKFQKPLSLNWVYWLSFFIGQAYLIFIGTRHEVFISGLFLILYISFPFENYKRHWKTFLSIGILLLIILGLNDPIRSLAPDMGKSIGLTQIVSSQQNLISAEIYQKDRSFLKHHDATKSYDIITKKNKKDTTFIIGIDTLTMKVVEFENQRKQDSECIKYENKTFKIPNPHVSTKYQVSTTSDKIFSAVTGIIFSNELFAGHFSMYGVLHYHVSPSFGISFQNLFFSFIPSFIKKERPQDAYSHYASELKLPKNQGFTINHITAWYINFGIPGMIIGPVCLALLLLSPFYIKTNKLAYFSQHSSVLLAVLITCFGSILVRTGPEGFKSILYEAIIIPFALIVANQLIQQYFSRFRS